MKKRIICIIISILLIFAAVTLQIVSNYETSCNIFVENSLKGDITREINAVFVKKFESVDDKLFKKINMHRDGNIESIEINASVINLICNEISSGIHEMIIQRENYYGMPMGNTLGLAYFSGQGPEIGVNVIPSGYVEYTIDSSLESAGINQSLYSIRAEFDVTIRCLAPFHETDVTISVPMIISETLILGKVPQILFTS